MATGSPGRGRASTPTSVKVDSVVGKLRVDVKPQSNITVQVSGTKARVDEVTVHANGDQLVVSERRTTTASGTGRTGSTSTTRTTAPRTSTSISSCRRAPMSMSATWSATPLSATRWATVHFEAVASNATIGRVEGSASQHGGLGQDHHRRCHRRSASGDRGLGQDQGRLGRARESRHRRLGLAPRSARSMADCISTSRAPAISARRRSTARSMSTSSARAR